MNIDVKKLGNAIDNMTTICVKGRAEIKYILAEGFGVKFEAPAPAFKLKPGMKLKHISSGSFGGSLAIVATISQNLYALIGLTDGNRWFEPCDSLAALQSKMRLAEWEIVT